MKKYYCLFLFSFALSTLHAQNSGSNSFVVRQDTITLKEDNCEWLIKSMAKNDPGISLSTFLLDAIEKGKIKAFDAMTNKPIPANKIFTWNLPADSKMTSDAAGNTKIIAVQRKHSSDKIDVVRIYQDWYVDNASGKLQSVIKCIELREQIYSSTGDLLGHAALCKIYY